MVQLHLQRLELARSGRPQFHLALQLLANYCRQMDLVVLRTKR
jgi:hypothetical protein